MATTIATPAAAPAAASTPAPAAAPSAAPVSAPASAPAAAPAAAQPTFTSNGESTHVDPSKYHRHEFASRVLQEKWDELPKIAEEPAALAPAAVTEVPGELPTDVPQVEAPDAAAPDAAAAVAEATPAVAEPEVPEFDWNPPAVITPDRLTKMIAEAPEFKQLLEANPKLQGELYKTAREAAELKPYREIFPDLEMAKSVAAEAREFHGVRDVFLGSTTKEGTQATLRKIAELSYVRDEEGQPVLKDGKPVVGDDYYSFINHTVALDLESRAADVKKRFAANQYHLDARYKTQEEVEAAWERDQKLVTAFDAIAGSLQETPKASVELPPELKKRAEELDVRERALAEKETGSKVQTRAQFDRSIADEAGVRLNTLIANAISHAKKNGAKVDPFLEDVLPGKIKALVLERLKSIDGITLEMKALQALPPGDKAKTRRLAAVDRHYQQHAPEIIRDVFAKAGIQMVNTAKARAEQRTEQVEATGKTEIQGSRGRSAGSAAMNANDAYAEAQTEWQKANPGRPFGKGEQQSILPRVLQLMGMN